MADKLSLSAYDENEIKRIENTKTKNDELENFFKTKRENWNENLIPILKSLELDLSNPSNVKKIVEKQSISLSYKQMINDQINYFLNKRSREEVKLKKLKQEKFIFYATGFGLKTQVSEKSMLISAHISENTRKMELIESYIEFLRDTNKTLDNFGYSVKNIIELMNYLGG